MNEMSNQEWEKVQKVKIYRKKTLEVLSLGGSLTELSEVKALGMHLRIEFVKEDILKILEKEIEMEDKAQLIAECLVEASCK